MTIVLPIKNAAAKILCTVTETSRLKTMTPESRIPRTGIRKHFVAMILSNIANRVRASAAWLRVLMATEVTSFYFIRDVKIVGKRLFLLKY
jgi:hypothetical protein